MKFPPSVEEILKRLDHIRMRELPSGEFEIYREDTGLVIETVSKGAVGKAIHRLGFKKAQKKRKGDASW